MKIQICKTNQACEKESYPTDWICVNKYGFIWSIAKAKEMYE